MLNRKLLRARVAAGMLLVGAGQLYAGAQAPLDPNAFSSIGVLSGATNYAFNTGNGTITPTVTLDGSIVMHGTMSNGVAVFDFGSVNISTTSTVTVTGANPLAILSPGSVTINAGMNIGASGATPGPGGGAGDQMGGTGGGPGGTTAFEGAGFGGAGGALPWLSGGATYGDPDHAFFGGSGGGGNPLFGPSVGGGGGGALEISAQGNISIGGTGILDNGGNGSDAAFPGSAGSGGGIFLATPGEITVTSTLSANGGMGGSGDLEGGGGGGGRILLETSTFVDTDGAPTVNGGADGASTGSIISVPADNGSFEVTPYVSPVPEPGMIAIMLGAGSALLVRRRPSR